MRTTTYEQPTSTLPLGELAKAVQPLPHRAPHPATEPYRLRQAPDEPERQHQLEAVRDPAPSADRAEPVHVPEGAR